MAEKEKKEKKSWGYKDSKSGKKVSALRDMFDGGGRGGSGASFSTMSNADYKAAGGKDRDPNVAPSGFTRQTQDGRGETLTGFRGMMANPAIGGLLGAFTGGIGGAAMGALRPALGNQIRSNGGLLQTLGLQSKLAPNASMRPQARPAGLGAVPASVGQQSSMQASPQDFYGLARNPAMNAPLSSIGMSGVGVGYDPSNWNVMQATTQPAGTPYSNTNGPMGALGSKVMPNASNGMPPSGMSDQMYSSWLRNQNGAINVDNMTPEGLRYMYENYRRSPAFQ